MCEEQMRRGIFAALKWFKQDNQIIVGLIPDKRAEPVKISMSQDLKMIV